MSASRLPHALRQFMDLAMQWSFHERSRFAKAAGLSMPQLGILMQLHFCTQCGLSEISQRFDITQAAASQLVEKLVQGGLVQRSEDPNDRRARQIQLSARGRALIEKGVDQRYRWVEKLVAELDPDDRVRAAEALAKLAEAARKLEQA
jgi:DNA-binding MarR family transcriptional regulator